MSTVIQDYEVDKTYEDGKQYADDDKLLVKFETRAVKNEFETNKQGRPVFYEQDYINVITPGSRDVFIAPMDDSYKRRFAKRYKEWQDREKREGSVEGTLLAELTWMTKSQIAELNYSNIFTVEQLAGMSDANAMQFMGSQQLRQRAKLYLEAAAGAAPALRLQQELEQRDNRIAAMENQIAEQAKLLEDLKKRGR